MGRIAGLGYQGIELSASHPLPYPVEEVIALVRKLAARGVTIVIIEHTMQAMVRLVDRFVVLNDGAVLAEGQPADITRNPAVIDAYLGKRWRVANA